MFPKGFNLSKQKTILLVDGDTLCFRSAAAAETRSVDVIHKPSGRSRIFTTRTAFKDYLKGRDFEYKPDDYEFIDIQSEEDVSHPLHSIKVQLKKMQEVTQADQTRIFVGGKGNFREELPLPTKYKSGRDGLIRPIHLSECKEFAVRNLGAELINGEEADDALIYVGYNYLKQGHKVVLGSQDKDAHAYSGLHIYDFTNEDSKVWEVPEWGDLWLDQKGKVRGNGFKWYCHQMLLGDSTDDYKPVEILGLKFGEKSSYKLLQDVESKKQCWEVVVNQYNKWFKDNPEYTDWRGDKQIATPEFMLQLYHRCCRMMSTPDDDLDLIEFCKKEGLVW